MCITSSHHYTNCIHIIIYNFNKYNVLNIGHSHNQKTKIEEQFTYPRYYTCSRTKVMVEDQTIMIKKTERAQHEIQEQLVRIQEESREQMAKITEMIIGLLKEKVRQEHRMWGKLLP